MYTLNFVVTLLSLSAVYAGNDTKKRVKELCKAGNFGAIKNFQCADLKEGWLNKCLGNKDFNKDAALADLLTHCPAAIPSKDKKYGKIARHLYKYNQLKTLRVYLANGRCKKLQEGFRNFLVRDKELNVAAICNQTATAVGIIPGVGAAPAPTPTKPATDAAKAKEAPKDGKPAEAAPAAPVAAIEGSLRDWDEKRVTETKSLLGAITVQQAAELGQCNNACLGLTAEHFSQAGVQPAVVASLSVRCFRNCPPAAFAGLTKDMVKTMTIWPFIRRKQLRAIKPEVIVALPFDQLGIGKQNKKNVDGHACIGITKDQLKAIRKDKEANKLYKQRCIKNSGTAQPAPSYFNLIVASCFALCMAFA